MPELDNMGPTVKMYGKLVNATNSDLQVYWDLLIDYDHETFYDEQAGISMDTYAQAVHSEMEQRGMPHSRVLLIRESILQNHSWSVPGGLV